MKRVDDVNERCPMVQLNGEQQSALDAMMAGRNVFLTGEAGTGKSTVLREFRRQCNRACAVLAPTGVAAINVGGSTIDPQLLHAQAGADDRGYDRRYRERKETRGHTGCQDHHH